MRHRERGSALVVVLVIGSVLGLLGLGYLMLAEQEVALSQARADRIRSRAACRDVLGMAAAWLDPGRGPGLAPPPESWSLREADCVGARLSAADLAALVGTAALGEELNRMADSLCGTPQQPDLLLEDEDARAELAASLGSDVVLERLAISAPRLLDGRARALARVSCTVSIRRGRTVHARQSAEAHVTAIPGFLGDEVACAGGRLVQADGARARWGVLSATGDVVLPPAGSATFPWSGLPRGKDGALPMDFSPGGPVDWDWRTSRREFVLTELLGDTEHGTAAGRGASIPPALPDPWMAVRAGGVVRLGPDADPGEGRQPWPHDPRTSLVTGTLSHLAQGWGEAVDPSCGGADMALAQLDPALAPVRRFAQAGTSGGEALWREGGTGPARPAAEWLDGAGSRGVIALFLSPGQPPERVTLTGGAGMVLVDARRLVLRPGRPEALAINMPGEPFFDVGLDGDGDDRSDGETAGNRRWDVDVDADGVPDGGEAATAAIEDVHHDAHDGRLPDGDRDPTRHPRAPHEPFLNLDYPEDGGDLSVRVDFQAGRDAGRPVRDLDGDGSFLGPGESTSMARDAEGARVVRIVGFRGLIVNRAGDVVVEKGFALHGAVRASGDVDLRDGSEVSFDARLARVGRPDVPGLPELMLADLAWERSGIAGSRRPADVDPSEEDPGESSDESDSPDPGAPGGGPPSPQPEGGGRPRHRGAESRSLR